LIAGETGGPSSIVALNEVYDVANDSWTTKKPIHYPVDSYASAVVDGKIYVISGFEGLYHGTLVDYTQIYDPTTDSWSMGASLPESLRDGAAGATTGTLAPKRIYVIGGGPEMVALNFTQVYDPENDSWTMALRCRLLGGGWLSQWLTICCTRLPALLMSWVLPCQQMSSTCLSGLARPPRRMAPHPRKSSWSHQKTKHTIAQAFRWSFHQTSRCLGCFTVLIMKASLKFQVTQPSLDYYWVRITSPFMQQTKQVTRGFPKRSALQ